MLYETMMSGDATKHKEVSEDHLCQEVALLFHKVFSYLVIFLEC